ncbi:hypothetical protein FQA39_LY11520 [Lamprigera yunnana]|nr:hypothetical protein FQA39_LY11520 [Lamprigera yunnana]
MLLTPFFPYVHSELMEVSVIMFSITDIENDVAETTSADIGDCDLWILEDEEEDKENEEEDEENVENQISYSEIEASGNSRRTTKAISNLKCKKIKRSHHPCNHDIGISQFGIFLLDSYGSVNGSYCGTAPNESGMHKRQCVGTL